MTQGRTVITLAAMIICQSLTYWPVIPASPRERVLFSLELMKINGRKKSFQLSMKENRATVTMAGLVSGRKMLRKMRKLPQPSILAAAERSSGMERKNCRIRKTKKGVAAAKKVGTIRGSRVSSQPTDLYIWNRGIVFTWKGSIMEEIRMTNRMFLPGNLMRAKP